MLFLTKEYSAYMSELLWFPTLVCSMDWLMRLPENVKVSHRSEQCAEYDPKGWSHIFEVYRTGIKRDATNRMYAVILLLLWLIVIQTVALDKIELM